VSSIFLYTSSYCGLWSRTRNPLYSQFASEFCSTYSELPCNTIYHWAINLTKHFCQCSQSCAQNLLYDNTIPGFNTLIALITFQSTFDKGNSYTPFWCRHGFLGVLLWLVLLLMLTVLFVSVNGLFVVDS